MSRKVLAGVLCVILGGLGYVARDTADLWGNLALNLIAEVAGVFVTVVILEWFVEKQQRRREMRRKAIDILEEVDHAVWVWQGGARGFNAAELTTLVRAIEDADPLPPWMQNLLMRAGSRSGAMCNLDPELRQDAPQLYRGLQAFSKLAAMRDNGRLLPVPAIRAALIEGTDALLGFAGISGRVCNADAILATRNPSVEAQEKRHYGVDEPPRPASPSVPAPAADAAAAPQNPRSSGNAPAPA